MEGCIDAACALRDVEFVSVVHVAGACGEQCVAYSVVYGLGEGAVEFESEFELCSVVAYHIDCSLGEFVAVLFVDPSGKCLGYFGVFEGVDFVPPTTVGSVGGEEAPVVFLLEGHAEVVAIGVDRVGEVADDVVVAETVGRGAVDVEPSESASSVAGVVEVAVRSEGGKHFVARSVDGWAEVFDGSYSVLVHWCSPDVESAKSAWHVGDEVEPEAVGRDCGVCKAGECVGC